MDLQALQEKYENFYAPRFVVDVDGREFTDREGIISDLKIDTTMDGADGFSFALQYPYDWETGQFEGLDWDTFAVGSPVEIWMGYGSGVERSPPDGEDAADPAFVGSIETVKSDYPASGTPSIQVTGFDGLKAMMKGERDADWQDTSLSDVVKDVAGASEDSKRKYFTSFDIDDVGITVTSLKQLNKTDYDFLTKEVADKYGFEIFARRGTFYFKTRDPRKRRQEPILTLRYGESLSSFSPEINDGSQVQTVEVRHWDSKQKEPIVGTATQPNGSGTRILRVAVESEEMARKVAEGELIAISQAFVAGSGETVGIPELRAGVTITIEGVGEQFSREYFVTQATHNIGGSGYTTSFQVEGREAGTA